MNRLKFLAIFVLITLVLYLLFRPQKNPKEDKIFSHKEIQSMSEDISHLLANTLRGYVPHYDFQIIRETLEKIEKGEEILKPAEKCREALVEARYKVIEEESRHNLNLAEQFLASLSKRKDVVEILPGKLYIEVIQRGMGPTIEPTSSPSILFTETNLNHKVVRKTKDQAIKIKISETIAGFRNGIAGMQIGERRKIYVHPSLSYGHSARQQLSIFDVEIVSN